ncbi:MULTISPECIES: 3'-5' exonuclease [Vibrio]|uniref:3'-5' exonuclease n=1 Tax=Vibrio TaxID=662 RepID=UPI001A241F46|nr:MULTISPECIES: 3'-5' exonuclease [Vibrio]EJG1004475.1 3'-5' exonuclease [Vibrio parahaemolyticus]HAS8209853.1 3'-5' exonuclease [Vibrio vulnificus]MBO1367256.1 DNA polymerase III subunit epsilon [Vibrio cholerae]MBO1371312.1 DNA polymerase III subunit epsilon [Vibrio cholerae]MBO1374152.1 DNA polymerase III subunit epsilon [Vibrio cholerae]
MEETNKHELEAARTEAIKKDQCFSKGRLRDEFRMKPKPGAEPVAFYKNAYGGKFGVYKISDCVPMKARTTKPPSEKQKRARAILSVKAKLKSNEAKASCKAIQWLDENPLFLDSETTGIDDKAQILELAISDAQGRILLETRLRPTVPIDREAEDIHGITAESLANSPTWPEVSVQVQKILCGRSLIIFNADFDTRMLRQTSTAFGEPVEWVRELKTHCAMYLAADTFGPTNQHGSISLANAVDAAGIEWRGAAHGAVADTLTTVDLVQAIADIKRNLDQEIAILENKN